MEGLFDLPPALDTPEFREAWDEWKQHRKELKKPLTPTASRRLLLKLEGWGADRSVAAIINSIENSWQGIFEPKADSGCGPSTTSSLSRSAATLTRNGFPTVGEAWEAAMNAMRAHKGFNSLHPMVLAATRQFGTERLRNTEHRNMSAAFAQFRQLYEEALHVQFYLTLLDHLLTNDQGFERYESVGTDHFIFLWKNWLIRVDMTYVEGDWRLRGRPAAETNQAPQEPLP